MMFRMKTVFVAMSGGIDSSYAAYTLVREGHRVIGCTFTLLPKGMENPRNPKACCSAETRSMRSTFSMALATFSMPSSTLPASFWSV